MAKEPLPFDPVERAADNWQRAGWGEVPRMRAVTSMMRAHQLLITGLDELMKPLGLTFARWEVLALLHFSRTGALSMGRIGERLQVHATSVTSLVQRLVEAGFIERVADERDRRSVLARLTGAGREVMFAGRDLIVEHQLCLNGMTEADADQLSELLVAPRRAAGDFVD